MKAVRMAGVAILIMLLSPSVVFAQANSPVTFEGVTRVTVKVNNISPPIGTVEVTLFNTEESFMKEPYRQQSGQSGEKGIFVTEFKDITSGEYAVVVVHDANDNGKLDTGFLGFGGESYGFSNNVTAWFGYPDFEEAKIITAPDGNLVEIDLQ
jgi:uncharacterized protein (DUF2141 family)